MYKAVEKQIGELTLSLEVGNIAKQADGAVLVRYGDSIVLASVCVNKKADPEKGFLPLTVEYREKSYAIGKIPGNFFRREGRPNAKEILTARLIDRPLRPLFPKGFKNEVQIIVTVLSSDQENDQDILGLIGSSAACAISPLPIQKIVSAVRVGYINNEYIINPTFQQCNESDINIVVAGSDDDIIMVEGNCFEVSEDIMIGALEFAKTYIKILCDLQRELCGIAAPIMEYETNIPLDEMIKDVYNLCNEDIKSTIKIQDKTERNEKLEIILEKVFETFGETYPESENKLKLAFEDAEKKIVRDMILTENIRIDGRKP
ncbi:polyribonucleotide nucleotidyltransferase, partial [Candidatus Latescibacterota bacterium]